MRKFILLFGIFVSGMGAGFAPWARDMWAPPMGIEILCLSIVLLLVVFAATEERKP